MPGTVLYRLRYGHKAWSRWFEQEQLVFGEAVRQNMASEGRNGHLFTDALMWVEKGYRPAAKKRIVPMTAELDGKPLGPRYRNPMAK